MNDPQTVLTSLESAPALLFSVLAEIPESLRKQRPEPDKWSAHEHFCHLAAFEPVFLRRLELMLKEDNPSIEPYSPSPEEEEGSLLEMGLEEALERFATARAELVDRLRALPPGAWDRTAEHPDVVRYTVFLMARHAVFHTLHHGYKIEETLFRKDWWQDLPRLVEEVVPGALAGLQPGEVNGLGPFKVPGLAARWVRIYLPRGYDPATSHFAVYLFDGQNVFGDEGSFSGGWYAHEAAESLVRARRPVPVVIGIEHGGGGRNLELSPFAFDERPGEIETLLAWVTGSLMPALNAELNLIEGPLGAVIGGSSMGGLAALYSHFAHPEAFGGALVMSPSFWVADEAIFAEVAARPIPPVSRVYLDGGAREDRGRLIPTIERMVEHLRGRGYESDRLMWRPDARGAHNEASWRRRLPKALRFMYR